MCVKAEVFNPFKKNRKTTAVVVFDLLSHISFIKDELRQELELPTEETTTLSLQTFKADKVLKHPCDISSSGST